MDCKQFGPIVAGGKRAQNENCWVEMHSGKSSSFQPGGKKKKISFFPIELFYVHPISLTEITGSDTERSHVYSSPVSQW